jgi:excisionase family DNA binding protein
MRDNDSQVQPALESDRLAYPINDLAEAIGVGRSKLYEEIRDGRLQAKKLGSRTLITAKAAREYLSNLPDLPTAKAA